MQLLDSAEISCNQQGSLLQAFMDPSHVLEGSYRFLAGQSTKAEESCRRQGAGNLRLEILCCTSAMESFLAEGSKIEGWQPE